MEGCPVNICRSTRVNGLPCHAVPCRFDTDGTSSRPLPTTVRAVFAKRTVFEKSRESVIWHGSHNGRKQHPPFLPILVLALSAALEGSPSSHSSSSGHSFVFLCRKGMCTQDVSPAITSTPTSKPIENGRPVNVVHESWKL